MNLGFLLASTARRMHDKECLIDGVYRVGFREFNARVNQVAHSLLELGLEKGERVGLLMPNCHQYLEACCALEKDGIVYVPLNTMLATEEQLYVLNDAEVEAVLDMRRDYDWRPPVQAVEALNGRGLGELIGQIAKHREFLRGEGRWGKKREQRWKAELRVAVLEGLQARLGAWEGTPVSERALLEVASGRLTVAEAAADVLQSVWNSR